MTTPIEALMAGEQALFEALPEWTMQQREDLACAVFDAMKAAQAEAQPAAEPAAKP